MEDKIKKWEEISRTLDYNKAFRKIEKIVYKLPDGREEDFYIKKEGAPVCILALTKDNEVILAKQFRPGPNDVLLELPGGGKEKGETPEQAGERELLEETGYKGNIKLITQVYECAYSTINRYCLIATECEKVSKQNLEKNEFIEVVLMSLDKFRNLLKSGKMTDIEVGYLGLDYLKLL